MEAQKGAEPTDPTQKHAQLGASANLISERWMENLILNAFIQNKVSRFFELLRTGLASKFIKRAIMTFDTQFDADFKSVSGKKVT